MTLKKKNILLKDCWTNQKAKGASDRLAGVCRLGVLCSFIPQGQWSANLKESKVVLIQIKGLKSASKLTWLHVNPSDQVECYYRIGDIHIGCSSVCITEEVAFLQKSESNK